LGAMTWLEGVPELLAKLQACKLELCVITNGHEDVQYPKLRAVRAQELFQHIIVGGDEVREGRKEKPDPAIFRKACQLTGVCPTEAIHVGDSLASDVEGARQAGLRAAVWINCAGTALPKDVPKPDFDLRAVTELPSVLRQMGCDTSEGAEALTLALSGDAANARREGRRRVGGDFTRLQAILTDLPKHVLAADGLASAEGAVLGGSARDLIDDARVIFGFPPAGRYPSYDSYGCGHSLGGTVMHELACRFEEEPAYAFTTVDFYSHRVAGDLIGASRGGSPPAAPGAKAKAGLEELSSPTRRVFTDDPPATAASAETGTDSPRSKAAPCEGATAQPSTRAASPEPQGAPSWEVRLAAAHSAGEQARRLLDGRRVGPAIARVTDRPNQIWALLRSRTGVVYDPVPIGRWAELSASCLGPDSADWPVFTGGRPIEKLAPTLLVQSSLDKPLTVTEVLLAAGIQYAQCGAAYTANYISVGLITDGAPSVAILIWLDEDSDSLILAVPHSVLLRTDTDIPSETVQVSVAARDPKDFTQSIYVDNKEAWVTRLELLKGGPTLAAEVFQIFTAAPEVDFNFFEETTGLPCMPRARALVEAADAMFEEAPVLSRAPAGESSFEAHVPCRAQLELEPSRPPDETECTEEEEFVEATCGSTAQAARSQPKSTLARQVESLEEGQAQILQILHRLQPPPPPPLGRAQILQMLQNLQAPPPQPMVLGSVYHVSLGPGTGPAATLGGGDEATRGTRPDRFEDPPSRQRAERHERGDGEEEENGMGELIRVFVREMRAGATSGAATDEQPHTVGGATGAAAASSAAKRLRQQGASGHDSSRSNRSVVASPAKVQKLDITSKPRNPSLVDNGKVPPPLERKAAKRKPAGFDEAHLHRPLQTNLQEPSPWFPWLQHVPPRLRTRLRWKTSHEIDRNGGGPMCRTWTIRLWIPKEGGGVPLRGRTEATLWGLPTLTESQRIKCDDDSMLMLRQLYLTSLARMGMGSPQSSSFFEHPADPAKHGPVPGAEFCSACWVTKAIIAWSKELLLKFLEYDQCMLDLCLDWDKTYCNHADRRRGSKVASSEELSRYPWCMMKGLARAVAAKQNANSVLESIFQESEIPSSASHRPKVAVSHAASSQSSKGATGPEETEQEETLQTGFKRRPPRDGGGKPSPGRRAPPKRALTALATVGAAIMNAQLMCKGSWEIEEGQPFYLDLMTHTARRANHIDSEYPQEIKFGVPLGMDEETLCSPGVCPTKEELKGQPPEMEDPPPACSMDSYSSAALREDTIEATFVEED
ncbi:unnamed protein product, partial [Polarella glacialis]